MNWFGLGIMLKFQDNASVGLGTVLNSVEGLTKSLSEAGHVSGQYAEKINASLSSIGNDFIKGGTLLELGSGFASASKTMLSGLTAIGTETVKTGAKYENWRTTLKALYGDAEVAQQKLQWGLNLAAQTPFEVDDVTQAIIGFKAVGAEADKMFESSNGEMRSFLEYMGDLAALRPDVGLNGLLMGIRNLLGGDNGRSLKMRMDIDLSQFTEKGEWGDTTEEIMSQLVEASDKLANGLMGELEGTWDQMISNLEDQKTRFLLAIADNGFFDGAKKSLKRIFDVVDAIDDEKMAKIGKNIANAFNLAWKPIDKFVGVLAKGIEVLVNLLANNPMVSKLAVGFVVLTSAILGFGAIVLTVVGSLFIFKGIMSALPLLMNLLSKTFVSALPSILSFTKIATIGALVYKAWKSDFGGIRSILTTFMKNVKTAFSYSSDIANMGTQDMINALNQLDKTKFGDWLTYRLVQVRVLWMALVDAWNDNTLSDENFEKARQLGLLPLIEAILDAKRKIEAFWEGFKKGFQNVSDFLKPIVAKIVDTIGDIITHLFPIEEGVGGVKKSLDGLNVGKWERFGEITAYIVSVIGGLWAFGKVVGIITSVGKAFSSIIGIVSKVFGFIKLLGSGVGKLISTIVRFGSKVVGVGKWILTGIGAVVSAVLGFFGITVSLPAWLIGLIVVAIAGLVAIIVKNFDKIKEFIKNTWNKVCEFTKKSWDKVCDIVGGVWDKIKEVCSKGWEKIKEVFRPVGEFFGKIWDGIVDSAKWCWDKIKAVFTPVANFFSGLMQVIKGIFQIGWSIVTGVVKLAWQGIKLVIGLAWEGIKAIFGGAVDFFKAIWNGIKDGAKWVWDKIVGIFNWAKDKVQAVWTPIKEFFQGLWNGIKDSARDFWNGVCDIFSWAKQRVLDIWNPIKDFFQGIWNWIKDTAQNFWNTCTDIFNWAKERAIAIWNPIKEFFQGLWNWIKDTAQNVWNGICDIFNWAKDRVLAVWNPIRDFFSGIWNWIKDTASSAWNGISNVASSVYNTVTSVWSRVTGFFSDLWSGIKRTASGFFEWLGGKFSWVASIAEKIKDIFGGIKSGVSEGWGNIKSGVKKMVGLNTGGYVKTEGVAMLHPNEVVVNDELTQGLRNFLAERERGVELSTPLNQGVVNNIEINPVVRNAEVQTPVTREANTNIDNSRELFNTISNSNNYNNSRTINHDNTSSTVDNSIVFNEGAIQVTLENGGPEDVEKLFKLFMAKLKKEKSLRSTLNYRPSLA